MSRGARTTVDEMQNRILGQFQTIARKVGKSRDNTFEKLPLKERIRIAETREIAARAKAIEDKKIEVKNKEQIVDTWWSRGIEPREIKMLEQRALLV